MVELLVTIAIIGIVTGVAVFTFTNALPSLRADSAMQLLQNELRQAREMAVDQRRNILVTFQGVGETVTVRQNLNVTTTPPTVISTTTLTDIILDPNQMTFMVLAGVPDTPDGFGNSSSICVASSGICFNNSTCGSTPALPCTITFQGDGTVVNSSGTYINGTIFLGDAGNPNTARAVTILGATGRIKGYHYNGKVWF